MHASFFMTLATRFPHARRVVINISYRDQPTDADPVPRNVSTTKILGPSSELFPIPVHCGVQTCRLDGDHDPDTRSGVDLMDIVNEMLTAGQARREGGLACNLPDGDCCTIQASYRIHCEYSPAPTS